MGNQTKIVVDATDLNDLTRADLIARLAAAEESAQAMAQRQAAKLSLKVSKKGCLSLAGIRRFPLSFYTEEWETILDCADMIRKGIEVGRELDAFPSKGSKVERSEVELELIQAAFVQALAKKN